jgi:hypothetical protein
MSTDSKQDEMKHKAGEPVRGKPVSGRNWKQLRTER